MAVLGCIYKEVIFVVNNSKHEGYNHDLLYAFANIVKAFKTMITYELASFEEIKDKYTTMELVEDASLAFVNFQQQVDEFVALFKDSIEIIVDCGIPEYKDEVLPNFGNFIIWI